MAKSSNANNIDFLHELKKDNIESFEVLFNTYYKELYYFCLKYVFHKEVAEELVQDLFISIWEKRYNLNIQSSIKAYLFTSIKNRAISYLRSKIAQNSHFENHDIIKTDEPLTNPNPIEYEELKEEIQNAIKLLPEQCRIVFHLSRNSGLTYKQIANELKVSPETVKTHISNALKKIKKHLEKHWEIFFFISFSPILNFIASY